MINKRSFQSAKEVMKTKVVFMDGMATAEEAVEKMKKEDIKTIIIEKRDAQDAYGIVNVHDLIKGVIIPDKTSQEVNLFEIMTKPVISVPSNMDVRYVARMLMNTGLHIAPVEEDGKFIGMVSLSDIIVRNLQF
jgi:signal-transduction protein with cAMP-binding, CBS, and nucleotidyltransferase domain